MKINHLKFSASFKIFFLILNLGLSLNASSQYVFTTNATANVSSIPTGSEFTYTFNYSTAGNTTTGLNVVAVMQLPDNLIPSNESNFNSNVTFSPSQITSVVYSSITKRVTITYVNPLPAGVTGQFQIKLKYINGTTPNAYAPNLFTEVSFSNPGSVSPIYSDTLNIIATANNNFTVNKVRNAGGAINDLTIYNLSIGSTGSASGALQLTNPVLRDTLPLGVEFVEATSFSGSNPPTYDPFTRIVTWTWPSGLFNTNYSGNAYLSVRHLQPTYQVNTNACNSATLSGTIPSLPLGNQSNSSKSGFICFPIQAPSPAVICNGGGISAATASWLNRHVLAGTSGNSFSNGWTNTGNTEIDTVVLTYQIDRAVDVNVIRIGRLVDGLARVSRDTVQLRYKTNLNSSYTLHGTYIVTNDQDITITLPSGEYLTEVNFVIYGKLPIGGSQSFTYRGDVRTSAQMKKDGTPIVEGTTYNTNNVGDDGTLIFNNSQGRFVYNGVSANYSNCNGSAEIMIPRPVFNSPNKSTTNGTNFKASDTINYRFRIQLGGNLDAQNVVVVDTLDSRLTYIPGSSSIVIGSNTITPVVNGNILTWNLGTVPDGLTTYTINFSAVIAPGTPAATIPNVIRISSDNPSLFPRGTSDNENITVVSAVALIAYKGQNGCEPGFVYYPTNATTKEGDLINYKITVKNQGNVAARDLTFIDVFPFIGDTRGSQWFANLVGPVTLSDPSSTVYYNSVPNPCYADFIPAVNPSGCSAPVWSLTPPVNITSVTAIKITRSAQLPALDSIEFEWPMRVPVGTPANIIMNNTIYYQVSRADVAGAAGRLLPAAPNQVGMVTSCAPILGSLGDYVWIDLNKNGVQDEAANLGLNGIKVYLYGAGLDNQIGGGDDILLDSTFTGNNFFGNPGYYKFIELPSGKYYVKFQTTYEQFLLTPVVNQNSQTNGNNDANSLGLSGLVTIDASGSGVDKDNPTIDAGYYPIGSLGNYVWRDLNGNGLQDEPANQGINGKKVFLYRDLGLGFVVVDSVITQNDGLGNPGYYNFVIENSGNYRVLFPTGNLTTQNGAAGVNGNSDANVGTGFTPTIVMNLLGTGVAVNNPTIDAGYLCAPTSSLSKVYICSGSSYTFNGTTYSSSGNYSAVLVNAEGCDSTANLQLTVVPIPSANFSVNDNNQCVNSNNYIFTINAPQASVKYLVNYGDGTADTSFLTSFTKVYGVAGNYSVTVLALDTLAGCSTTASTSIILYPKPTVALWQNDTARCIGSNVFAFQNYSSISSGSIASTNWNFGDGNDTTVSGTNPVSHSYVSSGLYTIVAAVNSSFNCANFDTLQVNVTPGPIAAFSLNQIGCCGDITVKNESLNASVYEWTFSSLNSSYVFKCTYNTDSFNVKLNPGSYMVTLVAKGNVDCIDTLRMVYNVLPKPNAVFSYTANNCATNVQFNGYSFGANSFSWNFGDPSSGVANTSNLQNPSHIFTNPGTYMVRLIASNSSGCPDTLIKEVVINPAAGVNPIASFTFSPIPSSCVSKYKFSSTAVNASRIVWLFADGTSAEGNEVTKSFPNAGSYAVKMVAISSTFCTDTATNSLFILANSNGAVASFEATNANQCLVGNSFNFMNNSFFNGAGWNTNYHWNFGDGTFDHSNTFAFNKVYDTAGTYTVRLVAFGSNGCRDTAYQLITVKPSPTANFTTGSTCDKNITFTNTSINSLGNYWDMGDGGILCFDSLTFKHRYSKMGWYDVQLIAIGENGCTDTLRRGLGVNSGLSPTAAFTYSVDACTQSIRFNNTSTNGGSFIWSFGDASPLDSSANPVHGYSSAGNYSVTLTAFVGQGCTNSITQTITAPQWSGVYPPNAIFSYGVEACTNTITASGNPSNYTLHKWLWDGQDLGWGSMVTVANPTVGGHNLSYIVGYGNCYDTTSRYIPIQEAPEAGFDLASNTCSNTIVASNISKNANTFSWNFGDPSTLLDTALGNTASYTYPNNGTFTIQLIAKDLYGCPDTVEENVTVTRAFNAHIANFTFDNSLCNCKCQNLIRFQNLTPGNNNAYLWTFGDGTSSTKANPSKGFATAGIYQVTLTTVDSVGCMSSVTKMVNIPEGLKGPSASFNTDYQVQCIDNNNFNFYNTSSYMGSGWNTKYYWNFGDGTKDTTNSFIFNKKYTNPGNYIVSLVAEGNEGCRDTMTMFIQVRPNPCTGVLRLVNLADGTNWNVDPDYGGGVTTGLATAKQNIDLRLYPNPNDGTFTINFSQRLNESFGIEVRDMTGRMVYEQLNIENGLKEVNISAGQLSEGAYTLRILTSEGNISEKKFIVVR